ncbi:hypothetical protein QCA50_010679 [Cerrena zonata]|uniref:Uncharacterized protein n=1 Tax=Cerrena zonata TaxID=2478898 RepID=A0AAW0GBK8_9APHY
MPKVSTRKKPDVRSSIPTRIQPKRACNCKRSADAIDPSSLPPSKRIRTEAVVNPTAKKRIGRPKRNVPPKQHNPTKDTSRNKRERQPTTKPNANVQLPRMILVMMNPALKTQNPLNAGDSISQSKHRLRSLIPNLRHGSYL